jgi:hypothetical protein
LDLDRNLTSAGLGLRWGGMLMDLSYGSTKGVEAGSLQFSWMF